MTKIALIVTGLLGILLILLLVLHFSSKTTSPTQTQIPIFSPSPTQNSNSLPLVSFQLVKVTPDQSTLLKPNQNQSFTLQFDRPISLSWLKISLSSSPIGGGQPTAASLATSLDITNEIVTLITQSVILPSSKYTLSVTNTTNGTVVKNNSYLSDIATPTPAPSNNSSLSTYLPYETTSYKLSYNAQENVYVFNFKYDSNSSVSLNDQYNQAKADATAFIESKDIDINSIVIQWRYS